MGEKSRRRLLLEQGLAEDPTDAFLRYGLAMQCLSEGDVAEGRERLQGLIADRPEEVAACQQLGQSYLEEGDAEAARRWLAEGIARAKSRGDAHAAAEMGDLLAQLG